MSGNHDNVRLKVSVGTGNHLGKASVKDVRWSKFCEKFEEPLVTPESFAEYQALPKDEQTKRKGANGWYLRAPVNKGQRKKGQTLPGRLITLDADYLDEDGYQQLMSGEMLGGIEHFVHTTRSHTNNEPRVRIGVLCDELIEPGSYGTIVRVLCHRLGIGYFDRASARIAQMMFFPTISRDQQKNYIFKRFEGALYNPEMDLMEFEALQGDPTDPEFRPRFPKEDKSSARARAAKAEKPTDKDGPVGAWCNAYDVYALIEGIDGEDPILGEVYEMAGDEHDSTRVNYIPGSGGAGAQILDGGDFLYSWHDSDPAGDQLMNSFDLVRVHLFGDKDEPNTTYAKMSERPSWKAMMEFISENPRYREKLVDLRYNFDDLLPDDIDEEEPEPEITTPDEPDEFDRLMADEPEVPTFKRKKMGKAPDRWQSTKCDLDQNGNYKNTANNVLSILLFDKRLRGRIARNEFSQDEVLIRDLKFGIPEIPDFIIKDREAGDNVNDDVRDAIRMMLMMDPSRGGYGLKPSDADFDNAIRVAARNNPFHPIHERLSHFYEKHKDDDHDYLSEFLPSYLATKDNTYYRTIMRRIMIASIHRTFVPGCKWDYMPIIEGKQGIGKSTLVKDLYGEKFFGELNVDLKNEQKVVEAIAPCWGMEVAELATMNRHEVEDMKKFVTQRTHRVRMAYGHYVQTFLRQTVFWGTTNQNKPLRDPTGNRRFWIIRSEATSLDFKAIQNVIPKMWAQAYREYWALREQFGTEIDLSLKGEAKKIAEELAHDARAETVGEQWAKRIKKELFDTATSKAAIISEFVKLDYDPFSDTMGSATNWNKAWGKVDDPVMRIHASEKQLWEAVGNRAGVARHAQEAANMEAAIAALTAMGISRGQTKAPSETQAAEGVIRAPAIGGAYLRKGRHTGGFFHVTRIQDRENVRNAYAPWAEAHDPSQNEGVTTEDEDLI